MTIANQLLKLKEETNLIAANPILDLIDVAKMEVFENKAKTNDDYKRKLKVIENALVGLSYVYNKKYQDIFNAYNELVVFELLKAKVNIKFISEIKGQKTPDYQIFLNEKDFIFSDLKSLHFVCGNLNYIDIQEQGFKSKIGFEKEIKNSEKKIYFSSDPIVFSPFKKGNNLNHYNLNVIIEDLISKAINNYKVEQIKYQGINGLYLIDLTQMFIESNLQQGLPVYNAKLYGELNSGILWNVAFGEINDPTYNWVEFEGKPNIGKRLTKNGLLKDDNLKDLVAVAFITGFEDNKKIIGFHKFSEDNYTLLNLLYKICDFVNDDTNSRYYDAKLTNPADKCNE
jgi:hypothetical protein